MSGAAPPAGPTRRRLHAVGWALAVLASGWATWQTWSPVPKQNHVAVPEALPRPPSTAERVEVERLAESLAAAMAAAELRKGALLAVADLEAVAPDGRPWLPSGLPDNPLTAAVAWAHPHCPGQAAPIPAPDWLVCEHEGTLIAGGLERPTVWHYRASAGRGKE